jgi:RNA recognition motif-containing protein
MDRVITLCDNEGDAVMDRQEVTVYVGNLPWRTTEDELAGVFRELGSVRDVRIIQDPATGRSCGYGFVEFDHSVQVQKVVAAFNGREFQGRPLAVSFARPKPVRNA